MTSPSLGRSARRWTGAALAVLVCGWLAPGTVRAGCVHDLLRGDAAIGLAHFEGLASAGALSSTTEPGPLDPNNPTSPCAGGLCSRGPDIPASPPPSPFGRVPQWGCLTERPILPAASPTFDLSDDDVGRPHHRGLAIFHPPRAA
jgi:hypothetical protein